MADIFQMLPEIQGDELMFIQNLLKDADDDTAREFSTIYRVRRKDPQTVLLLGLLGFLGVAGVQRFYIDQIGMGLLYLLTGGICLIGTIIDVVSYRSLAFEFNQRQAQEIVLMQKNRH
jgi:TM2 domain-containing membrane protein YozV